MYRKWRGLGEHNILRCLEANGVARCYWDPQEYDETLHPGENIALAVGRRGLRTTREWRLQLARWRDMSSFSGLEEQQED